MPFQLIKLGGTRVDQRTIPHADTYAELGKKLACELGRLKAPCTAVAMIRNNSDTELVPGVSSRGERLHAEEQIALSVVSNSGLLLTPGALVTIPVVAMLIDIEPCKQCTDGRDRYKGHRCIDLFGPGRLFTVSGVAVTIQFVTGLGTIPIPIFYFTDQPPRGQSARAQDWKPINTPDRIEMIGDAFVSPEGLMALG
jgi:hypothetical protein